MPKNIQDFVLEKVERDTVAIDVFIQGLAN